MFVTTGDFAMPSVALTAARFSGKYGLGSFGNNLFANVVVDPKKQDGKSIVVYYDCDDDKIDGGAVRTMSSGNTWFVDKLIITSHGNDTYTANSLIRRHINFLCSVRGEPVQDEDDQIWYRFLHVALMGRVKRPGRTPAGWDYYSATLRVMWRPMSIDDPDYDSVVRQGKHV